MMLEKLKLVIAGEFNVMSSSDTLLSLLNTLSLDSIQETLENAGDDTIWRPFYTEAAVVHEFNSFLQLIEESQTWPRTRNKEKGDLLENLMKLVFSRFCNVTKFDRSITADNEIDLNINFNELLSPTFLQKINSNLICECKNMVSSSINVGTVTKLAELCSHNMAGMGMFVSLRGIGGRGWRYGEGKRRKLFLSEKIPIISFTIEEIKSLSSPEMNFYSLIKKKHRQLVDEVDYDGEIIGSVCQNDPDFHQVLMDTIESLKQINLLGNEEFENLACKIHDRYS